MNWEYREIECAACKEIFCEDEHHFNFMVYRNILEGNVLNPTNCENLMMFHLECCDESLIQKIAKKKFTCDDCKKTINDRESFWEITVLKERAVYNFIEPEWSEALKIFCEKCAQDKDMYIQGIDAIRSVTKCEFRDKIQSIKGTYIPSEIDT